jgi:hypothetical protein
MFVMVSIEFNSARHNSVTTCWCYSLLHSCELNVELESYAQGNESMSTESASSPMPADLPPLSKVYQDQMTTLSHGLARRLAVPEVGCLLV